MKGRKVQVFLRTPLYRGRFPATGQRTPLADGVTEILGVVVEERSVGLHLRVEELRDERGEPTPAPPFEEIVLPASKIDFLVVLGSK